MAAALAAGADWLIALEFGRQGAQVVVSGRDATRGAQAFQFFQNLGAFAAARRKKACEQKAVRWQTRQDQPGQHCRSAGNGVHGNLLFNGRAHQLKAGIADQWCAGIAHEPLTLPVAPSGLSESCGVDRT